MSVLKWWKNSLRWTVSHWNTPSDSTWVPGCLFWTFKSDAGKEISCWRSVSFKEIKLRVIQCLDCFSSLISCYCQKTRKQRGPCRETLAWHKHETSRSHHGSCLRWGMCPRRFQVQWTGSCCQTRDLERNVRGFRVPFTQLHNKQHTMFQLSNKCEETGCHGNSSPSKHSLATLCTNLTHFPKLKQ